MYLNTLMFKGIWILNEVMYFLKNLLHTMQIDQEEYVLVWILNTTPLSAVLSYLHTHPFLTQRTAHAKPAGHEGGARVLDRDGDGSISKDANSQAARLLRGPLCLLGPRGGRLVHDLPLARESRGPHEDPGAPPSRAPRGAPPALELPVDREKAGGQGGPGRPWAAVCLRGLPGLMPVFLSDAQTFIPQKKVDMVGRQFPRSHCSGLKLTWISSLLRLWPNNKYITSYSV